MRLFGYFIMTQASEGLLCRAHGLAGSGLVQAVLCGLIKVWVWECVKDGGSSAATKKPSMFCLPAAVIAAVLSFPPQESVFLFYFYP